MTIGGAKTGAFLVLVCLKRRMLLRSIVGSGRVCARLTHIPSASALFVRPRYAISSTAASQSSAPERLLSLNDLANIKEATKKRRRWGRGIGSGRGKNAGFGHQKSRVTPRAFEGGQTPLYRRLPKLGFFNTSDRTLQVVNLQRLQEFIAMDRLLLKDPPALTTMRDLLEAGVVSSVKDGVKLLAHGKDAFAVPIHLEVTQASEEAIKAVEAAGGTVTCVHFNTLAMRALIKPLKFDILPRRARPPPRLMGYYLDRTKSGYLSPEVQARNLKLFGHVTSESPLRAEFERFAAMKRTMFGYGHAEG